MAETKNSNLRNIKVQWQENSRFRTAMIVFGLAIACILGYLIVGWASKPKPAANAGASVAPPPTAQITAIPGSSNSPEYNKLVQEANAKNAQAAISQGKSNVPVLTSNAPPSTLNDPFPAAASTAPAVVQPVQPVVTPPNNPPVYATGAPQQPNVGTPPPMPNANGANSAKQAAYEKANKQLSNYFRQWTGHSGSQEFDYTGQVVKADAKKAGSGTSADPLADDKADATAQADANGAVYIRAGTVVPAQLLTPLNSDAKGPVLAEITSGPFKGARVMGSFQANENQIVVQFNRLSMPGLDKSLTISAYAVSQGMTAGLATDVNHHYIKRYGLGLAAAFISGYGEAVSRQNTTITTGPFGSTVAQGELSNSQISKSALGQVGEKLGNDLDRETTTRATIKAEGQGGQPLPIGLLFLSDF